MADDEEEEAPVQENKGREAVEQQRAAQALGSEVGAGRAGGSWERAWLHGLVAVAVVHGAPAHARCMAAPATAGRPTPRMPVPPHLTVCAACAASRRGLSACWMRRKLPTR